jgi:hypothetical protein
MQTDQTTATQITANQLELAVEVHNGLAKLVAPASPGSIEASSFYPHKNFALFLIAVCAFLSFLIFIASVFLAKILSQDITDLIRIIGGAGLGSSFYALYTASEYIQANTYDLKYNNTYMVRLGLGIISGLILAYFLKDLLQIGSSSGADSNGPRFKNVGVATLALVGGFAAYAVAQILTRVSDTLVTLVSGSDKDKAEANAEKQTNQTLNDTVQKLNDAISDSDPTKVKANVQGVVKAILTRK